MENAATLAVLRVDFFFKIAIAPYPVFGLTAVIFAGIKPFKKAKECCSQFSLHFASTGSHKTGFFQFGGGFFLSEQYLKIKFLLNNFRQMRFERFTYIEGANECAPQTEFPTPYR